VTIYPIYLYLNFLLYSRVSGQQTTSDRTDSNQPDFSDIERGDEIIIEIEELDMDVSPTGDTLEAPAGAVELSEDDERVRVKYGRYRAVTEDDFVKNRREG
jgi:hypothetical protein